MSESKLPEGMKERINLEALRWRQLTPEQITEELKVRAAKVKKQIQKLEEAKKISPETWNMVIDYRRSKFD